MDAIDKSESADLFIKNCAGCHIKGGNIVRRNKTLSQKDLLRNGIENPQEIAKIAREGIGSMSGYKEFIGEEEIEKLANWIWEQSQNAWTHG